MPSRLRFCSSPTRRLEFLHSEEPAVSKGILAGHGDGAVVVDLCRQAAWNEVDAGTVAEVLPDAIHLQLRGRHVRDLLLASCLGEKLREDLRSAVSVARLEHLARPRPLQLLVEHEALA